MMQNFFQNREERVERRQERRASRREKLRNLLDPITEMGNREREQGTNVSTAALPTQLRSLGVRSVNQSLLSDKADKLPEPKQQTNPAGADVGADSGRRIYAQIDPDTLEKDAAAGDKGKPESGEAVASPSRPRRSTTDQSPESVSQQGSKVKAQTVSNASPPVADQQPAQVQPQPQKPPMFTPPDTSSLKSYYDNAEKFGLLADRAQQGFERATTDQARGIYASQERHYRTLQNSQIALAAAVKQGMDKLGYEQQLIAVARAQELDNRTYAEQQEAAKQKLNSPGGQITQTTDALRTPNGMRPEANASLLANSLRQPIFGEQAQDPGVVKSLEEHFTTQGYAALAGNHVSSWLSGGSMFGPGHPDYPGFAQRYRTLETTLGRDQAMLKLQADVAPSIQRAIEDHPDTKSASPQKRQEAANYAIEKLKSSVFPPVPQSSWGWGSPAAWGSGQ
jgi:hypothetical protein